MWHVPRRETGVSFLLRAGEESESLPPPIMDPACSNTSGGADLGAAYKLRQKPKLMLLWGP